MPRPHIYHNAEPGYWQGFGFAVAIDIVVFAIGGFLWWLVRR